MRASRLLQMLLLLQNRGRLTTTQLARELEVARRTVLRDVDALTEAGLPVVVWRGAKGGIELGFQYRTRLTGLARDEAEALGVLLSAPVPALDSLGLGEAGRRARAKLLESLPDGVREVAMRAAGQVEFSTQSPLADARVLALAKAVRESRVVRVRANTKHARTIHPVRLRFGPRGVSVVDAQTGAVLPLADCGDVNISAHRFTQLLPLPQKGRGSG
ncbi:MAG: HTH domain-containing protein [Myxococcaceae bacterium]